MEQASLDYEQINKKLEELLEQRRNLDNEIFELRRKLMPPPLPTQYVQKVEQPLSKPYQKEGIIESEKWWGQQVLGKIGILIAVAGLIALIKYLSDNGLLGVIGKITIGYLVGVVMLVVSYVARNTRKILSSFMLIGGFFAMYLITWTGQWYFEVFSTEITLGVTMLISVVSCATILISSRKVPIISLLLIAFSPIVSGYEYGEISYFDWELFMCLYVAGACFITIYCNNVLAAMIAIGWMIVIQISGCSLEICDFGSTACLATYVVFLMCALFDIAVNGFKTSWTVMLAIFLLHIVLVIRIMDGNDAWSKVMIIGIVCVAMALVVSRVFANKDIFLLLLTLSIVAIDFSFAILTSKYSWYHAMIVLLIIESIGAYMISTKNLYQEYFYKISFATLIACFLWALMVLTDYDMLTDSESYVPLLHWQFLWLMVYAGVCVWMAYLLPQRWMSVLIFFAGYIVMVLLIETEVMAYYSFVSKNNGEEYYDGMHKVIASVFAGIGISLSGMVLTKFAGKLQNWLCFASLLCFMLYVIVFNIFAWATLAYPNEVAEYVGVAYRYVSIIVVLIAIGIVYMYSEIWCRHSELALVHCFLSGCVVILLASELYYNLSDVATRQLWISLYMAVCALILFLVGFRCKRAYFRQMAIVLACITALKVVTVDVWNYSQIIKAITLVITGGIFLLVSHLYTRYFKDIK